jgi:hypothetical protein
MADGRQHIEDTYGIISDLAGRLDGLKGAFSGDEYAEFEMYLESAQKWVKLCRGKVWLRGKEGTEKAQQCLDAANEIQPSLDDPAAAIDSLADLSTRLESLARVVATKSQVMT